MTISLIISSIQKIALYETKDKFFVVGSNNNQTKFRILRIDRTDPCELNILDDKIEYTEKEVHHILQNGFKSRGSTVSLPKPISAFGIVGFVKFLEGYYLLLVTKRRRVASIGMHVVYKIEDTSFIYIPHESYRIPHHDEPRYLKMFKSVDLSSNFYFSYSYDITHSFQINAAAPKLENLFSDNDLEDGDVFTSSNFNQKDLNYGVRSVPNRKFVWNNYLLSKIEGKIHSEWILYIMHGFMSQSNVSIFGRSVYITLIARRSNKYAGTRFLKRGANCNGDVANEVETEQMVIDVGVSSNQKMRVSSFVQMRGSVPSQWRQDVTKMVAKPAITFDLSDPYYEIAGAHFNQLFRRYGSPIIILNLVKKREKKKHESQLSELFDSAVTYLNKFLPFANRIQYISFDMARMNKGKEAKVMDQLAKIARSVIAKTGFLVKNGPIIDHTPLEKVTAENSLQTGVIRVNCVDCLDRTNTAQFALGKCALGYQLYCLGLLNSTSLEFDSDCVRLLEALYEDHGDTLALQYGGSQLVHRIKTYRKTAPWTSQGNDIMQTLSRYYSNTFSDTEKQHAINLFLGLYVPSELSQPIWEQNTDYYLHHPEAITKVIDRRFPLTQWWEQSTIDCLPLPYDYLNKEFLIVITNLPANSDYVDIYNHYHATDKICVMGDTYEFKISHSMRDFMPQCVTDFSPFTVRIRPGRMREETATNGNMKNPSLTGKSSASSTNSSSSETYESEDDDDIHSSSVHGVPFENSISEEKSDAADVRKNIYGICDQFYINETDMLLYKKYEIFEELFKNMAVEHEINDLLHTDPDQFVLKQPVVTQESIRIYEDFCEKRVKGLTFNNNAYKMTDCCALSLVSL